MDREKMARKLAQDALSAMQAFGFVSRDEHDTKVGHFLADLAQAYEGTLEELEDAIRADELARLLAEKPRDPGNPG